MPLSGNLRGVAIVSWTAVVVMIINVAVAGLGNAASRGQAGGVKVAMPVGTEMLGALLWRPQGRGPFPAVLINHGSGRTREQLAQLGPYERMADNLGPVFIRHGYVMLFLFRHGVGPSTDLGKSAIDLMNEELAAHGQNARNLLQMKLLEGREMADASAGLAFLERLPEVDHSKIAVVGFSFGGSLTVLMTEREPALRAAVVFAAAGYSWDNSPELRARLLEALRRSAVPIFFLHAANDYSTNPGRVMDAELERLGKPHRLQIYPAVGQTADEGHDFINNSVAVWERDVFSFMESPGGR